MAFKEWFRRLQPMQLYLVLLLTCAFFSVELITSHITHALTLLVNAYHMLCNIIALSGCIASIKYSNREDYNSENCTDTKLESSAICAVSSSDEKFGSEPSLSVKIKQSQSDRRMKNTFGWARINILTMLVCCVFLASFCFSLQVEALQTLIHVDHMGGMDHPLAVLCIGVAGIFLNAFCYILIGGYTFYHGSSLHVTKNGEVIIKRNVATKNDGERSLSTTAAVEKQNGSSSLRHPGRQGIREMFRDVLGCVFVILVSVLVYYTDPKIGKFIDPVIAIVSSTSLFVLSYPYMKESGLILLQTIPNHININSLQKELLEEFPGIVNVHDLHVWQLTGEKIISTAHIMFLDPTVYANIRHQVTAFFIETGITQVTIQPEFQKMKPKLEIVDCLIKCQVENCIDSRCCSRDVSFDTDLNKQKSKSHQEMNKMFDKNEETLPAGSPEINLESFTERECEVGEESSSRYSSPAASRECSKNFHDNILENNKIITCAVNVDEHTARTTNTMVKPDDKVHKFLVQQTAAVDEIKYDRETV